MSQREANVLHPPPPALPPLEKGEIVGGKYAIDALIGCGAMGYVVSATHIDLGQSVALKFLRPELVSNPSVVARFATEARAVARINSEHVARVFDVGVLDSGAPFIVMELLTGSDLAKLLGERTRFTPESAVAYILQACEALAIAHSCGIVHRDIKPENLFLARTMQGTDVIKVLDFGISKLALSGSALESPSPLVRTIAPLGSPVYMSPEQIRASTDIDARTDIWSIGCVLYELLAGKVAFDAPSITQLCAAILEQPAPSLRLVRGDIHPRLDGVIARCLEKRREHRYADVAELAIALMPFAPATARESVERCCYVLRKLALPEERASAHAANEPYWKRASAGLSLTPATLDRSDLIATAVEGVSARAQANAPRHGLRVVGGTLAALGLAVTFWLIGQRSAELHLGGTAPGTDALLDQRPAPSLAVAPVVPPAVTAAPSLGGPSAAVAAASAAAKIAGAPPPSGAALLLKSESKSKRPAANQSAPRRGSRVLDEPDVGF